MRLLGNLLCFLLILHCSYAPPVGETTKSPDDPGWSEYMEYHRYLKEVVDALESDPDFREHLNKASDDDIKSGKLADQLDFVNHNVRTKLDEIKRRELDRLRHLATKQFELMNAVEDNGSEPTNEHLDHANPHTFEIEDLKKLIFKATADLEALDKKRREEFKEYEMQKKFDEHQKVEGMDETQKKEYMETVKKEEDALKHHQPLHHPGSKQQLEEVWEEQDHMDQGFDPKAFFMMHDVDGNGVWDADEVKALFIKELDKLYAPNGPNKDLHERAEEMERMREHVFQEYDHNRDGLIEFREFMSATQKDQFNKDEGWKTIEDNEIYTQNEYDQYEKRRVEEMKYLQQRGLVDARGNPVPGAQHQIHEALMQYRAYQQQQAYQNQPPHPGQPQYYPQGQPPHGQVPQYQQPQQNYQHPGQVPQYQGQFQGQHPPQGQFQGQQPPQGQFQGQQPPQGQFQGQQPPQGQFQGQQPPQGQYQGQQPPQGQYQGQQPPQGQYQEQQPPQGQFQGQQPPQGQFQAQQPRGTIQGQQPSQGQEQQPPQGQFQGQAQAQPIQNNVNQAQAPPVSQSQAVPSPQGQAQGQSQQTQDQGHQANKLSQQVPAQTPNQSPPVSAGATH